MKRYLTMLFLVIPLLFLLTSCGPSGPGPASWIDKPLDKSTLPLEPLEIIAHASSVNGVSSIEFAVDDQVINTVRVGNSRFVIASHIWQPEEPGVYTVRVTSLDTNGNRGSQAVSLVYIGDIEVDWILQDSLGYGDCGYVEVFNFIAEPPVIPQGECSNLYWEVISPEDYGVIVDGAGVPPIGEMQVCPEETRPFELIVESAAGMCKQWQTVYVDERQEEPQFHLFEAHPPEIIQGECSILIWEILPQGDQLPKIEGVDVPFQGEMEVCPEMTSQYTLTSEFSSELIAIVEVIIEGEESGDVTATPQIGTTPTLTVIPGSGVTSIPTKVSSGGPTDTPTPDTTSPQISNASVSPNDFIYNTNGSCSPTTFKFSAQVTDASGISSVRLNWTGSGIRSGSESMNYSGGKYVKDLGLFVNTGSLSNFSITATDNAGNSSTKNLGWSLDVEECGGS